MFVKFSELVRQSHSKAAITCHYIRLQISRHCLKFRRLVRGFYQSFGEYSSRIPGSLRRVTLVTQYVIFFLLLFEARVSNLMKTETAERKCKQKMFCRATAKSIREVKIRLLGTLLGQKIQYVSAPGSQIQLGKPPRAGLRARVRIHSENSQASCSAGVSWPTL